MGNSSAYNRNYYYKANGKRVAANRAKKLRAAKTLEKYKLTEEEKRAKIKMAHISGGKKNRKPVTLLDKKILKEYAKTNSMTAAIKKVRPEIKCPGGAAHNFLKRPAVQSALLQAQKRAGISESYLTRKLKEGLDAKETKFFAHEGVVQDSRDIIDFNTRHKYLETAHKLRGDMQDGINKDSGAVIINITEISGAKPAEVIEAHT